MQHEWLLEENENFETVFKPETEVNLQEKSLLFPLATI